MVARFTNEYFYGIVSSVVSLVCFSATELMARIRVALRHYYRMNQKEEVEKPDDAVCTNGI